MKTSTLDKISCFLAELIGTALLVFLACMGCIQNETFGNDHFRMVVNVGLVVMVLIQSFGCVSGAHFNPAVTLAAYIYELTSLYMSLLYVTAQMLGAFIGYGLLKILVPAYAISDPSYAHGLCVTVPHKDISGTQAVFIEAIITGVLILICCGVWDPRNAKFHDSVAIRFGLGITALACAAGPFTGGSMNPARSFAPALWNRDFDSNWVYWIGPLLGAGVTAITYKTVFRREAAEEPISNKLRAMEEMPLS